MVCDKLILHEIVHQYTVKSQLLLSGNCELLVVRLTDILSADIGLSSMGIRFPTAKDFLAVCLMSIEHASVF